MKAKYGCECGKLYEVDCRNFMFAVCDGDGGFIGIRYKWGDRFLDKEYDWEQGPPHGTVKPIREMGQFDGEVNEDNDELFKFLESVERELK